MITKYGYIGSQVRALAVNYHGSDDDELEESNIHDTVMMMGLRTAYFLTQPRRIEKVKELEEVKK